jgi:dipeptidyl aminopeptidase/acylaminoacyl peptidase
MQSRFPLLIGLILLPACTANQAILPTASPSAPMAVIVPDTPTPTKTPLPTSTPTLDEWIYPYTIDGLRERDYQSGEIRIRETLVENEFYSVYYIDYPSDGLTITGVMYIPVGEGPFPVIVMNHGYFNRGDFYSGDGTDRASEFLVMRGYITVSSDYRSWGDSDIGPSLFYSGLAIDVINLLDAIPSIPQADATRVGMWGHSMGGGATMKVLAIDGGRVAPQGRTETTVKAAVLYSTVSADNLDLINRWGMGCFGDITTGELLFGCNSSDIIPDSLPRALQDAYQATAIDPEKLKATSPFYYLSDVTVPMQIHYGTEDGKDFSGTPPEWSRKLYQGFLDAGKTDVEIFAYDGEGHSFFADEWFAFMERSVKFFDLYLK